VQQITSATQDYAVRGLAHDAGSYARDKRGIVGTLQDLALIALAWGLLIGVIVYPVAQLIGLLTCAIALAIHARTRPLPE
jgi:hypothetical protein